MGNKQKKKKVQWQELIGKAMPIVIGFCLGIWMASQRERGVDLGASEGKDLWGWARMLLFMVIGGLVQMIIHEGGHLVFGLLTGYKYVSFRIGSWMWLKQDDKIVLKRLSLAGTGGQCLMAPPDLVDGKMPVILYNMGGVLLNIMMSIILFGIYKMYHEVAWVSELCLMTAAMGFLFALLNGIPLKLGTINNDGYNAIALRKDLKAQYAFWIQLKVNEEQSFGKRIKDMPEEWFMVPSEEEMQNSMCASVGVFTCNRLIDALEFKQADELMEKLLAMDGAMVGIHRHLLICDRIYCELIGENRPEKLAEMLDKKQKDFMKSMGTFPAVIRTQYVYALLGEKDEKKAIDFKKQFEKYARTYPYESDIENQRELIEIAEAKLREEREV